MRGSILRRVVIPVLASVLAAVVILYCVSYQKDVAQWGEAEVAEWFSGIGLEAAGKRAAKAGWNGRRLLSVRSDRDLSGIEDGYQGRQIAMAALRGLSARLDGSWWWAAFDYAFVQALVFSAVLSGVFAFIGTVRFVLDLPDVVVAPLVPPASWLYLLALTAYAVLPAVMASFAVSLVMLLYGPGGVVAVAPFSLAAGFVVFANVHSLVELAPEDDGEHGRGASKAKAD